MWHQFLHCSCYKKRYLKHPSQQQFKHSSCFTSDNNKKSIIEKVMIDEEKIVESVFSGRMDKPVKPPATRKIACCEISYD